MAGKILRADIEWRKEQQFHGSSGGRAVELDGDARAGLSPMELLLFSLAGCMGIDVVHILEKMRTRPESVKAFVEGTRAESEPRRFVRIKLKFEIRGTNVQDADIEKAIRLSLEKYCSVYHTLRNDLEIETSYSRAS
jgi:putative redox protein